MQDYSGEHVHACARAQKMCERTSSIARQEETCALIKCYSKHSHNIFKLVTNHFRT